MTKYNYTDCGIQVNETFPHPIVDHKRIKYVPWGNVTQEELDNSLEVGPE